METGVELYQPPNGKPFQLKGYWANIVVREGDAWKIWMSASNDKPSTGCDDYHEQPIEALKAIPNGSAATDYDVMTYRRNIDRILCVWLSASPSPFGAQQFGLL